MVRKFLSDLISGVRDGVAWALFLGVLPPRRRVWSELPHVGRGRESSPPWADVVARADKKRAELAAKNRYGRYLDLSLEETEQWASDDALRTQWVTNAKAIADAFGTAITIITVDGRELAVVQPSTHVLEHDAQKLDGERDASRPAAGGGN
jgi:hypothetical protein